MLIRFAPLLALVGCWSSTIATPRAAPAPAAICSAGSLLLPTDDLRLPDGRSLSVDKTSGAVRLWDPETRRFTDLGPLELEPAGDRSFLARGGVLHDIDPDRSHPGLRPIWTPHELTPLARIAGVVDGVPVTVRRDGPELVVTCLAGFGAITERRIAVDPELTLASSSGAVAGHRILVTGRLRPQRSRVGPSIEVSVVDLDTSRVRAIGRARSRSSADGLVSDVRWRRTRERLPQPEVVDDDAFHGRCQRAICRRFELISALVDPDTEAIVSTSSEVLNSAR